MGGIVSPNLTSTYFGSNPEAVGATGGNQSFSLALANLAQHNHDVFLNDPGHIHGLSPNPSGFWGVGSNGGAAGALGISSASVLAATTNITIRSASGGGGIINKTADTGSGAAFSLVQPSITMNYIIKVTPDVSVSGLFGVASLGGMQGIITCGTGLICAGNDISVVTGGAGGANTQVQFNDAGGFNGSPCFIWVSPALTVGGTGCTGQFKLGGTTSGFLTQTVGSIAGTPIITWGNTSGTPAVTASGPLVLNTTTGNLTITGSALTKTDDTNVTLTLGGNPASALLASTSLTLGWTGTLAAGRLNSNVVQSVVNDTNVTGSISAQALTLGWTGQLALTRGGSGQSTALAARSSAGFNVDQATSTGDANYTILSTDRMVYHTALTAARTDTLPAANSVNAGQQFVISDFRGVASASNTITLQRAGADTINGVTSVVAINAQYGAGIFWSDGISRWTFFPASSGGGGGTVTNVSTAGLATGGPITTTGTVTVTAATKSDQETGTSTTTVVTPANQKNNDSSAKAWVLFTGSTPPVILSSYNVTSVTRASTGVFTINFTTAFASTNYGCTFGVELTTTFASSGAQAFINNASRAVGSITISTLLANGTAVADPGSVMGVCFGRQ